MPTLRETVAVEELEGGLLAIHYDRVEIIRYAGREDQYLPVGGDVVFERSAAEWLVDKIERAVAEELHDTYADLPPDHFASTSVAPSTGSRTT